MYNKINWEALWEHQSMDSFVGAPLIDAPIVKKFQTLYNVSREIPELEKINISNKVFRIAFYVLQDLCVVLYYVTTPFRLMPKTISPPPLRYKLCQCAFLTYRHDLRRPKPTFFIIVHEHKSEDTQISELMASSPKEPVVMWPTETIPRLADPSGVVPVRGKLCAHAQCINYIEFVTYQSNCSYL
jgi:hypothetical protein